MSRRPRIPAAVIADRGVPITLTDGTTVSICYGFRSLMRLEEQYGSINDVMELIGEGEKGAAFTSLANILACGLMHESLSDDDGGAYLGEADVLADYLDSTRLEEYAEAMGRAFELAFPSDDDEQTADPTSGETTTALSPGASGTGQLVSASDSQTTNSGA